MPITSKQKAAIDAAIAALQRFDSDIRRLEIALDDACLSRDTWRARADAAERRGDKLLHDVDLWKQRALQAEAALREERSN